MSQKLNSAIAVIGIDTGKNSFHVIGQDERGAIVLRQKWSRGQVEARLVNLQPCLIGMEASVGAHHLSCKLQALGHDARLMPAKDVKGTRRRYARLSHQGLVASALLRVACLRFRGGRLPGNSLDYKWKALSQIIAVPAVKRDRAWLFRNDQPVAIMHYLMQPLLA
jgi:hypothetical protein